MRYGLGLKRIPGLSTVSILEINQYGIPAVSLRGTYDICRDETYVDHRCLKRYRRKWVREMRRRHGKHFIAKKGVR
jgi:hypothetical protein